MVFLVVLVSVMVLMRHYLLAAVSGRWRQLADQIGYGRQYEPCVTTINGHTGC